MQLYLIDPLLLFGDQQDQQETDDKAKQEEKKKIIRAPLEKHDSEMEIFVNNPAPLSSINAEKMPCRPRTTEEMIVLWKF